MTHTYEIKNNEFGNAIVRSDGLWIPTDPANSDYQAYLATLASESPAAPTA